MRLKNDCKTILLIVQLSMMVLPCCAEGSQSNKKHSCVDFMGVYIMFCANFEKFIKVMVMIVSIVFFLQFISCSGGAGGTSDSDFESGSTRSVYSGDFNVNGGHYNICTLEGNEQGGSITLSNGSKANLLGTYGSSSRTAYKIEGYYTVTFNGVSTSYSYSLVINTDFFAIREMSGSGSERFYAGSNGNRETISAGSVDDPFNRTEWSILAKSSVYTQPLDMYFLNGNLVMPQPQGQEPKVFPYQVLRTDTGYRAVYNFTDGKKTNATVQTFDYIFNYDAFVIESWDSKVGKECGFGLAKYKTGVVDDYAPLASLSTYYKIDSQ